MFDTHLININYFLILIFITLLNILIYKYYNKFYGFIKVYDIPDKKIKNHKNETPLSGGLSVFTSIIITFLLINDSIFNIFLLIFFISGSFYIGLLDDKKNLNPIIRVLGLSFLCVILVSNNTFFLINDIKLDDINLKLNLGYLIAIFFTIFCYLSIVNSLNFIDGIDGLSSLLFIYILIFLFLVNNEIEKYLYIIPIISLFIYFFMNILKKSFLGDSGIYALSSLIFILILKNYNQNYISSEIIILILFIPGIDLIRIVIERLYKNRKIYVGDKNHLHHLLINNFSISITLTIISIFFWLPLISYIILELNFILIITLNLLIYSFSVFYLGKKRFL